ncbi:N-acetyltransferase [Streptomyces subrutilus]|nr:N-acetyltransferase [Streptomyces subrutilus]
MAPLVHGGRPVRVAPVDPASVEVGDIVLARVAGTVHLHLVTAVDAARRRVQIGNNRGHVNGWTGHDRVFGICLSVDGVPRPRAAGKVRPADAGPAEADPAAATQPDPGPLPVPGAALLRAAFASERLDLLPVLPSHAAEMAGVLADPALHAFIGGAPLPPDALRTRYGRLSAGSPDPAVVWGNWVVRLRSEGCLVGTVQATIAPAAAEAELAWVVGSRWQGRGIATEAARALADRLRELRIGRLLAHVHPAHAASAAVAAACGLRPTPHRQDGEVRWAWAGGTPPRP